MSVIFPFIVIPLVSRLTKVSHQTNHTVLSEYLPYKSVSIRFASYQWQAVEPLQVEWLMNQFNHWFVHQNTRLVKGAHEPEYFPATDTYPAQIVFAHGFFASALHEISHWCVAGKKRRLLNDFGYWYAPDGRNAQQQYAFEQVEIVPQAIECLLTLMCGKSFRVSQDNLSADFDTKTSTFAHDVAQQAILFWQTGKKLPSDAEYLLNKLKPLRPLPLTVWEIKKQCISDTIIINGQDET